MTAIENYNPAPDHLLDGLNNQQQEVVTTTEGPLLVLAGAGTGKMRALTTRLAYLLRKPDIRPYHILTVTFTNKAAREMKDRVESLVKSPVAGWWLGTFHSLGARLLRQYGHILGFNEQFTILDLDDQLRLVKNILKSRHIEEKMMPAKRVVTAIQRWKDRGLIPERVTAAEQTSFANTEVVDIYREYQERLHTLNAMDFGDLLLHCLNLFRSSPELLERLQSQFRYLLVDEYQDTNIAQYLWLRALTGSHHNICCVGDEDQSIYSWRGAEIGNILRFEKDYPEAKVVRLEQNYRSTPHILKAASHLITHNQNRLGKNLWTEESGGHKIRVQGVWDADDEARFIGNEVETLQRKQIPLSAMAVLVRAGFQTREFEERFIQLGIPYRVVGGPRFYERLEIRNALAYFRIVIQPNDDLAFERIVNTPKRGIGQSTIQTLYQVARAENMSLYQASENLIETDELRPSAKRSLSHLLQSFERWRLQLKESVHSELAQIILEESGYVDMFKADKSPDAPGRLENLKELITAIDSFQTLQSFIEHVSLVLDQDDQQAKDQISLMTLHGAKGLEFPVVFLPGWEEGLFPHQRAIDDQGQEGLEEERRLAYVGLTRARQHLMITFAANRRIHNQWQSSLPSRFLDELPSDSIEFKHIGGRGNQDFSDYDTGHYRTVQQQAPCSVSISDFSYGQRVFHQKFGYGTVMDYEGNKLYVDFDQTGEKKIMKNFVVPAEQAG